MFLFHFIHFYYKNLKCIKRKYNLCINFIFFFIHFNFYDNMKIKKNN